VGAVGISTLFINSSGYRQYYATQLWVFHPQLGVSFANSSPGKTLFKAAQSAFLQPL
jgi:hypothetical protein